MKIAIVTDTHFNHAKCVDYDQRAVDSDVRMSAGIDQTDCDVLLHLGDVSFGEVEKWHGEIIWQLNRQSPKRCNWLVRGNHDNSSIGRYLEYGWDAVVDELVINRHGFRIHFTHKPLETVPHGTVNIHGHQHLTVRTPERIGLHLPDNDYKPYMLDSLLKEHRKSLTKGGIK